MTRKFKTSLFDLADLPIDVTQPDWQAEQRMMQHAGGLVAGVDEVGRGPLAGPVVACAVILDADLVPAGLQDSKKLSAKRRAALADSIKQQALGWHIAQATVAEIDELNILQASLLAMRRAIAGLTPAPSACLIDGNQDPQCDLPTQCLIKGDSRSVSIAAASILAKVFRDELMARLAEDHPAYGWERNAGYGVKAHMEALDLVGPSPHHRKSFAPIQRLVSQQSRVNS